MGVEHLLHLGRVDVEAVHDDHVALAVQQGEEAVRAHHGDVPGAEPAVRQHLGRLLRLVPVPGEDLGTAHQQLARLTYGQRLARVRLTDDPGHRPRHWHPDRDVPRVAVQRVGHDDRRGLGHPVALHHLRPGRGAERLDRLPPQLHSPGHAGPDRVQTCRPRLWRVRDLLVDGRHAGQDRRPPPPDLTQHEIQVELGDQHDRAADEHGCGQAQRQPEHVEHGQYGQRHVLPGHVARIPRRGLARVGHQVRVREHRALGRPGGAAGVLQHRDVTLRVDRDVAVPGPRVRHQLPEGHRAIRRVRGVQVLGQRGGQLGALFPGAAQRQAQREPLDGGQVLRQGGDDHVLHRGAPARVFDRFEGAVEDDDDPRAAVGELGVQLSRGVERVVLHHDRAPAQDREEGDDLLRAVGQHHRDPVALVHAEPAQRLGELVHLMRQFPVGQLAAQEDQRRVPGVTAHGVVEQIGHRHAWKLGLGRHPGRVIAQPGPCVIHRCHDRVLTTWAFGQQRPVPSAHHGQRQRARKCRTPAPIGHYGCLSSRCPVICGACG
jgi:hypothetical protein